MFPHPKNLPILILLSTQALYGLLFFILWYSFDLSYAQYADGFITITAFISLLHLFPAWLVIVLTVLFWLIVPGIVAYCLTPPTNWHIEQQWKRFIWLRFVRRSGYLFSIDAAVWALLSFLLQLPEFIPDQRYFTAWLGGVVFLFLFRFCVVSVVGLVVNVFTRMVRKYMHMRNGSQIYQDDQDTPG